MRRPAPFSTISSNGDDPGRCGHVGDAIRTLKYLNVRGCTSCNLPQSPNDPRYLRSIILHQKSGSYKWLLRALRPARSGYRRAFPPLRTYPHSPGSSRADEMVNLFANLARCPKLGCFLHRAGATTKGKCVHYMRVPMPPVHPAGPGRCLVEWVPRERTVYVGKRSNSSRLP